MIRADVVVLFVKRVGGMFHAIVAVDLTDEDEHSIYMCDVAYGGRHVLQDAVEIEHVGDLFGELILAYLLPLFLADEDIVEYL